MQAEFSKRCPTGILQTMSIVLRRISFSFVNRSSISVLLKRLRVTPPTATDATRAASSDARVILTRISKTCPNMYKAHLAELAKAILDETLDEGLAAVPLQAFAHVERADQGAQTNEK